MGRKSITPLHAALAAACLAPALPAMAGLAQFTVCGGSGGCGTVRAIDDAQLAAVAGKFTIAGEVVGMSLTMTSSWQAANGQKLEAAAGVSIALPRGGQAGARFHAHAGGSHASASGTESHPGSHQVRQGQGLAGVNGVAQVIQVAGDANDAVNRAGVRVSHEPLAAMTGNGHRAAAFTTDNGGRAQVAIDRNSVSMQLSMPAEGSARQQLGLAGSGGIHQGIHVAADGQQVVNQLQLQVQMQQLARAAMSAHGLQRSLDMLRGR